MIRDIGLMYVFCCLLIHLQLLVAKKAEEKVREDSQWPGLGKTRQTVAQRIGLTGQSDSGTVTPNQN